ncbi:TetR/AcrR family transcriptional regulator [Rhizorhapis sp. SPR117]|uniref:TetR/AcrR family transcriptional regulator n=1 Tax=Rhizorhapis sp. SPR117 TaxID=2912611 RepID=UPI001F01A4C4
MTTTKKSVNTRQKILDVCARWLREQGLAFTSMANIAADLGVKTSSIYYHFESKDALVTETLNIGIEMVHEDVRTAVEELGPDAPHRERIRAGIKAHLRATLGSNDYSAANILNYAHAPPGVREQNLIVRAAYGKYWGSLLEDAQHNNEISPDFNLSITRMFLIGALNWSVEWYDPAKGSVDDLAEHVYKLFVNGVAIRN